MIAGIPAIARKHPGQTTDLPWTAGPSLHSLRDWKLSLLIFRNIFSESSMCPLSRFFRNDSIFSYPMAQKLLSIHWPIAFGKTSVVPVFRKSLDC